MHKFPNSKFQIRNSKKGFTLIELVITMGITAMLASILISYSTRSRQHIALYVESAKIVQVIARAKSLALSTYSLPVVPCGYGVHFGYGGAPPAFDGTYEIFSYNPASCSGIASINTGSAAYQVIPGGRYSVDTSTVTIVRNPPNSLINIFFVPPGPAVLYWDITGPGIAGQGNIYVSTKDSSALKTIRLNSQGQITL